jgi:hypothetical protein
MVARAWASRVAVVLASAASFLASAASAETLRATYGVTLIGLPSKYSIDARARLSGLASMVSNSRGASTGTGAIIGGHVAPATFATTASNSTMTRTIRMALVGNAVKGVEISPPFEDKPDRVPLGAGDKQGIVDPVGAFVLPAPAGGDPIAPAACDRTLPIFDGYTRFNIALAYVGKREVKAKGYSGPVAVCSVRYIPISGHRPDRPATKFMTENKDMEVWLAPVGGAGVLMPFRVSVRTMIGTAVVEATEFSVAK